MRENNYVDDMTYEPDVDDEREMLLHVCPLGIGYKHGQSCGSYSQIQNGVALYRDITGILNTTRMPHRAGNKSCSMLCNHEQISHVQKMVEDSIAHIKKKDIGYSMIDLRRNKLVLDNAYIIEDAAIRFLMLGTNEHIAVRIRKGPPLFASFYITPDSAYLTMPAPRPGQRELYAQLEELHLVSTIQDGTNIDPISFVVDYDASQSNSPLLIPIHEQNSDIIRQYLCQK